MRSVRSARSARSAALRSARSLRSALRSARSAWRSRLVRRSVRSPSWSRRRSRVRVRFELFSPSGVPKVMSRAAFRLSRLAVPSAVAAFSSAELPGRSTCSERSPIRSAASSARTSSGGSSAGFSSLRVRVRRVRFSGFSLFSVFSDFSADASSPSAARRARARF